MARYRLNTGHYINALQWDQSPTEWEYTEQSLVNNRMVRRRFKVPMLLDFRDATCCNYPGEIIVSSKPDDRFPADIIFEGEPTPDMTPLDDEARAEVEKLSSKWVHPIEALPGNFSQSLLSMLEGQINAAANRAPIPTANPVSTGGLDNELLAQLARKVADLEAAKVKLQAERAEPGAAACGE